ncbi:hypothetical protein Tco_0634002 [Tanacetum coccineum]
MRGLEYRLICVLGRKYILSAPSILMLVVQHGSLFSADEPDKTVIGHMQGCFRVHCSGCNPAHFHSPECACCKSCTKQIALDLKRVMPFVVRRLMSNYLQLWFDAVFVSDKPNVYSLQFVAIMNNIRKSFSSLRKTTHNEAEIVQLLFQMWTSELQDALDGYSLFCTLIEKCWYPDSSIRPKFPMKKGWFKDWELCDVMHQWTKNAADEVGQVASQRVFSEVTSFVAMLRVALGPGYSLRIVASPAFVGNE